MNFWNEDHPLSADNTRLFGELVPSSGSCPTVQGECLRAASKIGYDWYNNGWGCNNWSGAVVFLRRHANGLAQNRTDDERLAFRSALSDAHEHSHGERVSISDERADAVVTLIQAYVVQCILDNPVLIPNSLDMWELSEPDAPYEEEDEEDDFWDEE